MKRTVILSLGATLMLTACGHDQVTTADPDYFYSQIREGRTLPIDSVEPGSLAEALPNYVIEADTVNGPVTTGFSELVVTGRIIAVEPGDATVWENVDPNYEGPNEEAFHLVDFDDPAAHSRNVLVTISVDDEVGGGDLGRTVKARLGVPAGADPEKYMASIRGIGRTLAILNTRGPGRYEGEYYLVMGGTLLGDVAASGAVAFPGLGGDERDFVESLDTVEEVMEAAGGPKFTEEVG